MTTTTLSREELDRMYPVSQLTRTGKWGWRRTNGSLNSNSCSWETEHDAINDREQANQKDDLGSR